MTRRYIVADPDWTIGYDDHQEAALIADQRNGTIYVREDNWRATIDGHIATIKSFLQWYRDYQDQHSEDTVDYTVNRYLEYVTRQVAR